MWTESLQRSTSPLDLQDDMSTYVTCLLLEILLAVQPRQADGYCPAVPAGRSCATPPGQRIFGQWKGNEDIPASPSPDCLRKDANVCRVLPGGQTGPAQAGSVEGSSAQLSGLTRCGWGSWGHSLLLCHRLGHAGGLLPSPGTPHATQPASLMRALLPVCAAGDPCSWGRGCCAPFLTPWAHRLPSIPYTLPVTVFLL